MTERRVAGRTVPVSNLDKRYFPESGFTKGDVLDYYERISPQMLSHIAHRPLVLQRFPDGITDAGFFQKNDDPDFSLTGVFARRVAEVVVPQGPFTLEHRKADRKDRLFVDIFRNATASHVVAPYSLRPLPAAPVAAPLDWDEALDRGFDPQRITLANVFRRMAQKRDPWAELPRPRSTIASALHALDDAATQ